MFAPRGARQKQTGLHPTDRRGEGSTHQHIITDARGIPVVTQVAATNVNDITHLAPMVDGLPEIQGRRSWEMSGRRRPNFGG